MSDNAHMENPASGASSLDASSGDAVQSEPYNFSRSGQISHEQMRAIGTVNDLFARNLMHTLNAWLRTNVQIRLASSKPMTFTEFLGRVQDPTYICSVRMEPLGALGLLQIDLSLSSPIVDLLLGGVGRATAVRNLTDIEQAILTSVVQMVVRELNVAWQPVGLRFALEKRETAAQVAHLMPAGEKTICVSFDASMPEASGGLNLCLPTVVLNAILREMVADRERPRRRVEEVETKLRELLGEVSFGTVLQFPPLRLLARDLVNMAPGTILKLPLPRHSVADFRVAGVPLAKARPVRIGEHRGAQILAQFHGLSETPSLGLRQSGNTKLHAGATDYGRDDA